MLKKTLNTKNRYIKKRLRYLKKQIENECISYSEIVELQGLKQYITDDVILAEWSGIAEEEFNKLTK